MRNRGQLRVKARNTPFIPPPDSQEDFLKEHYWGFDRTPAGKSFRYQVDRPVWQTYPVETFDINFDPGALLGPKWQTINWDDALHSVLVAKGSAVKVYEAEPL